jgi:hypothetical protein
VKVITLVKDGLYQEGRKRMDQPTLGYDDFCQILGRVTLDSYLRFEKFNRHCQEQIAQIKHASRFDQERIEELQQQIEILQVNLDIARRERQDA